MSTLLLSILKRGRLLGSAALMMMLLTLQISPAGYAQSSVSAPADEKERDAVEQEESGEEIIAREQFYYMKRAGGPGKVIPDNALSNSILDLMKLQRAQDVSNSLFSVTTWVSKNPVGMFYARTGANYISGRTNVIAFHPTDPNTMYAGAAGGGVWKTTDGGINWVVLTDGLGSLTCGAVAIDPNNPNTIFFGTGELNFSLDSYYGIGIFRSTNGGTTWSKVGTTSVGQYFSQIVVDPTNSLIVYAAGSNGVYRSTNGGSVWSSTGAGTNATSLMLDPTNTQVLYTSRGVFGTIQIKKTTNGGSSWTTLGGGLPSSGGRAQLAMAPSDPNVLYASIANSSTYGLLGLYKTTDGGTTWTTQNSTTNYLGGQGWYDNSVTVHPTDPTRVVVGGLDIYVSTNSGVTLIQKTNWATSSSSNMSHADIHFLGYNGTVLFCGSDGGVYKSPDNGNTWSDLNATLSTLQYQSADYDPTDVQKLYGGTQDNNLETTTNGGTLWIQRTTGDGGYSIVDPVTPNVVYGQYVNGSIKRSADFGVSFSEISPNAATGGLFYNPYEMAPGDHNTVVFAQSDVWKTTSISTATTTSGWTQIAGTGTVGGNVSAIGISYTDPTKIYIGTSSGAILRTTDDGANWSTVSGFPYISDIVVDKTNDAVAYASCTGFAAASHVFKTTNSGTTWTSVSGDLPNTPVNSIVLRTTSPRMLFVGTDIGVFQSTNDGASWLSFNNGLPAATVYDLKYKEGNGILLAATHGRGVFTYSLSTAEFTVSPSTVPFGSVLIGASKQDSVTVSNVGFGTLSVTSAVSDNGQFSVSPSNDTVPAASSKKFYITYTPSALGVINANIVFTHNATGSPDTVTVSGTGFSNPPTGGTFTVTPDTGVEAQTSFTLTSSGWTDPDPPLQYKFAYRVGAGPEAELFAYSPSNSQISTLPAGDPPSYILRVYGYIADAYGVATKESVDVVVNPSHLVSPESLPFGNLLASPVGANSKTDSFYVKNLLPSTFSVLSATSNNGEFTISPASATLTSGDSAFFSVEFRPISAGGKNGNIILTNSDATSDTVVVNGTGIVPVTLYKFKDADGNVLTSGDQTAAEWHLALYKDSVSVGTLVAEDDSSMLSSLVTSTGTYIACEADSGAAWTRIGGNGTRYDTLTVTADAVADTFVNFRANAIVVRKFIDIDNDLTTDNDRIAKSWHLELRKDSLNGTVVVSNEATSILGSVLGDGTYYAVEADSAAWTHIGYVLNGVSTEDSVNYVQITIANGESDTLDFVNASPVYSKFFRTATYEDWATSVDQKGKTKSVKKKADKVDFKFNLVAPANATGLIVKFNVGTSGVITKGKAKTDTVHTWFGTDTKQVSFNGAVLLGDTFQVDGRGYKGKQIVVSYEWLTSLKSTKGKVAAYKENVLRLPMPNLHNVGEELFGQSVFPSGLLVGVPQGIKGANSVIHKKYSDVLKSMNKKGLLHSNPARCLDEFDTNHKPIDKQQKGLPPDKHNNILFAELLALKLNVAASAYDKFPSGIGQLTYLDETNPTDLLNGQTVDTIIAKADRVISCIIDLAKGDTLTPDDVYDVVAKINEAFADSTVDTSDFSSKTMLKGVRRLIDVPYLHATAGLEPKSILASSPIIDGTPIEFKLNQNYPNPFNPTTVISFELPEPGVVTLKVFNVLGQEVAILFDREELDEGTQEAEFNANSLSSGLYFYRLTVEPVADDEGELVGHAFVSVRKMLLLK